MLSNYYGKRKAVGQTIHGISSVSG